MLWYRVLLAGAISVLISIDAISTALIEAAPSTFLTAASTDSNAGGFLRVPAVSEGPSKDTTGDDNNGGDLEVRVLPESLMSLNTFKSFKRTVTRATQKLSEHVSPMLPMKSRVQVWSKNEKSLDFVKKQLGMEHLAGTAIKGSPNFQYYDDFVTSQLPVWTKKQLTPTEVKAELGLENLAEAVLTNNPNFKYYDEYLNNQVLVWGKEDLGVDDVLIRLGLNTLAGTARTEAVNYKYYEGFVANQMRAWLKDDVSVLDVMAKLKLDHLSGEALLSHPNYPFYKYFVKTKLKTWAANWVSEDEVAIRLGLEDLAGPALRTHPNYRFLDEFNTKGYEFQLEGWLKQGHSTYDIWRKLELDRVHPTQLRQSPWFDIYEDYVNTVDDYIINLMKDDFDVPNIINTKASVRELDVKTQIWTSAMRPEEYVKYSLGLKGLEGDELKAARNYEFFEYYLKGLQYIK